MGLLNNVEERRRILLEKANKNKEKYIDYLDKDEKDKIINGIKEQRKKLLVPSLLESGPETSEIEAHSQVKTSKKNGKKVSKASNKKSMTEIVQQLSADDNPVSVRDDVAKITEKLKSKNAFEGKLSTLETREETRHVSTKRAEDFIKTGIPGFDELLERGIPKGSTVLVAGGAGSGKTILSLQTLYAHAQLGKKCLYMSFEEHPSRLEEHMEDFGWNPDKYIKKGNFKITRTSPFDVTRNVDALLAKEKGELLIDIDPVIIPKNFKPDFIVVDSLTAIASAFSGKEESYRIYIEQLFKFFEKIGATAFLITETEEIPKIYSRTGVEEFLADGVIVLYQITHGNLRENAIEVLKMRGANHQKRIVAMRITDKGVVVYPTQEIFSEVR